MSLDKHLIGLTGEYFVAGVMSMKGWVASLTLKNYPSVDIFGLNSKTGVTINIQVKTTRVQNSYNIGLAHNQRNAIKDKITCPFVFVHIDKSDNVRYFVLTQMNLIDLIEKTDDDYYNKPRNKPLKEDYPIAIELKHLIPFENAWEKLWEK